MARTRASCNPMPPEGCWIQFRLNLLNVKQEDVAKQAKRSFVWGVSGFGNCTRQDVSELSLYATKS